jgi:predicted O-methyltransferase YrrM
MVPEPVKTVLRRTPPYRRWAAKRNHLARLEELAAFAAPLEANGIRGQLSGDVASWARFLRFAGPGHFYSPIPQVDDVLADADRLFVRPIAIPGIDTNDDVQRCHIREIVEALDGEDLPDLPTPERRYYAQNDAFGIGDATMLVGMLRRYRPARIVEIGSGHSSALMLDTIERDLPSTHLTCVEPFSELLRSLMRDGDEERCTIVEARAQDIDPALVRDLGPGDLLFIDSTHVVRTGSDVCRIVLDLLPQVRPGVIVHIHDMFWPFELPRHWFEEGRQWAECYLVRAMLMDNPTWEILLYNDYVGVREYDLLLQVLPRFLGNPGGSLWLRRLPAPSAATDGDDGQAGG